MSKPKKSKEPRLTTLNAELAKERKDRKEYKKSYLQKQSEANLYKRKYYREKSKAGNRLWLVWFFIFFGAGSILFAFSHDVNVDENAYCLQKMQNYFPEYEFTEANYDDSFLRCEATHKPSLEQRDGLRDVTDGIVVKKVFELTNKEDKKYMQSDDLERVLLLPFSGFFWLMSLVMILFKLAKKYNWG